MILMRESLKKIDIDGADTAPWYLRWFVYITFILAFAYLGVMVGHCQSLTLLTPMGVTPPGTSAVVQVLLTNSTATPAPILSALQFTFVTPGDIGQPVIVAGPAAVAAGKQISCNLPIPSINGATGECILWGMNLNPIGNGVVATATLPVSIGAKLTTEGIGLALGQASDANGNAVSIASMGGTFSVYTPCDFNHDGVTDIADVNLVVAQVIASVSGSATACTTGDLTGDKKCSVLDVYREILAALPAASGIAGAGVCRVGP